MGQRSIKENNMGSPWNLEKPSCSFNLSTEPKEAGKITIPPKPMGKPRKKKRVVPLFAPWRVHSPAPGYVQKHQHQIWPWHHAAVLEKPGHPTKQNGQPTPLSPFSLICNLWYNVKNLCPPVLCFLIYENKQKKKMVDGSHWNDNLCTKSRRFSSFPFFAVKKTIAIEFMATKSPRRLTRLPYRCGCVWLRSKQQRLENLWW